jgi:hypothetical protein
VRQERVQKSPAMIATMPAVQSLDSAQLYDDLQSLPLLIYVISGPVSPAITSSSHTCTMGQTNSTSADSRYKDYVWLNPQVMHLLQRRVANSYRRGKPWKIESSDCDQQTSAI